MFTLSWMHQITRSRWTLRADTLRGSLSLFVFIHPEGCRNRTLETKAAKDGMWEH